VRIWKLLGVAGLVGIAATGVAVARAERKRRAYTPEEVRERLRERARQVDAQEEKHTDGGDVTQVQPD
jgi:hypothetical protein